MTDKPQPPLTERLAALAAFLPIFESPDFSFGDWVVQEGHFPYFASSEEASRFVGIAYNNGWVTSRISWAEWKQTIPAMRFANDPNAIDTATVHDLECLLTTFIRQERFNDGGLAGAFNSGHLTAIVRRADALLRELNV